MIYRKLGLPILPFLAKSLNILSVFLMSNRNSGCKKFCENNFSIMYLTFALWYQII